MSSSLGLQSYVRGYDATQHHQAQYQHQSDHRHAGHTVPLTPREYIRSTTESAPAKPDDTGDSSPPRKRISRACDACNNLRTKCDGALPCSHCTDINVSCTYLRARKKRGKASRRDLAALHVAEAASTTLDTASLVSPVDDDRSVANHNASDLVIDTTAHSNKRPRSTPDTSSPYPPTTYQRTDAGSSFKQPRRQSVSLTNSLSQPLRLPLVTSHPTSQQIGTEPQSATSVRHSEYAYFPQGHTQAIEPTGHHPPVDRLIQRSDRTDHGDARPPLQAHHDSFTSTAHSNPYSLPSPKSQNGVPRSGPYTTVSGSPLNAPVSYSPGGRLELPSPRGAHGLDPPSSRRSQWLRYPVLMPVLPRVTAIIPVSLACDLLDVYFASLTPACTQPASPYILAFPIRKRSVLRSSDPRPCSKALLVSMLWVGAHTSESPFLTSPPSQRIKVCNQLLELCINELNPLVHVPTQQSSMGSRSGSISTIQRMLVNGGTHPTEADGPIDGHVTLDDVITYLTIATLVSASEYKAASLRWWTVGFSLARELKLGREQPDASVVVAQHSADVAGIETEPSLSGEGLSLDGRLDGVTEETREERRRTWWLLYAVDRHLSFCYNKPLHLRDAECQDLLQPECDAVFQQGEFYPVENTSVLRNKGPCWICTGHGMFGYFLPLMTILGHIVDVTYAKDHPIYGALFNDSPEQIKHAQNITHKLNDYAASLGRFEAQAMSHEPGATNADLQTKTVVAYGTHIMHTLHIALNGKWDPISLLDDNDLWISSPSFLSATGHAVSAAEAVRSILDLDPDLSFMPFFFGIYLLQGSFLLLLIADKLRDKAAPNIVRACETVVRAHEVCVVTLNTEYQRNFRNVMRSALAQVKGRGVENDEVQERRRREVLLLYRWTGDGTGLAL